MNERIKELAEQAGYIDMGNNHTAYMQFDHEKFAELVVRECIYLLETSLPYNPQQKMIKKHFGIEE